LQRSCVDDDGRSREGVMCTGGRSGSLAGDDAARHPTRRCGSSGGCICVGRLTSPAGHRNARVPTAGSGSHRRIFTRALKHEHRLRTCTPRAVDELLSSTSHVVEQHDRAAAKARTETAALGTSNQRRAGLRASLRRGHHELRPAWPTEASAPGGLRRTHFGHYQGICAVDVCFLSMQRTRLVTEAWSR
jgi:hypothetical protein